MRVAAIDAIFSRAARLGRRDVGDAFTAAQFSPRGGHLATRANQLLSSLS